MGPLVLGAWVCVLMIPLCFLAMLIGSEAVSAKATTILLADFAALGGFVGLQTIVLSRRGHGDNGKSHVDGGKND